MKLTVISTVAAFLLCLVIAERNGPTNILTNRRRANETSGENLQTRLGTGERIINVRRKNPNNVQKRPGTLKVMGVSRTPRNSQRKFPGMITAARNNHFTARSQRSDIIKAPGRSSPSKLYQKRRSLELGIESDQKIEQGAIFLEPVLHEKSKTDSLGYLFGKHFIPDEHPDLGPSIGPLRFPGIGKNVYIRLMVPPDEETTSHVTVHLVNKAPVESFSGIYESLEIAPSQKPKQLFTGKNSVTFAPILTKPLVSSRPMNSRRSRFVDKSFYHFGFTPSMKHETSGLFRVQKHQKIHQDMASHREKTQFGYPRQYFAAPNHHQLPVALRPAENLNDLPIYPPLSAEEFKDELTEANQSKANFSTDVENADDTQQSGSSRHTSVSRNYVNSQTAWQPVRVPVISEPEVTLNRGESPQPVFMEEIKAPDLSSGNISVEVESPWGKLNGAEYGPANLQVKNNRTASDAQGDKHVVLATLDYPSRHTTNYLFSQDAARSGERNTDNPKGGSRSTTSSPLPTTTGTRILEKKKIK